MQKLGNSVLTLTLKQLRNRQQPLHLILLLSEHPVNRKDRSNCSRIRKCIKAFLCVQERTANPNQHNCSCARDGRSPLLQAKSFQQLLFHQRDLCLRSQEEEETWLTAGISDTELERLSCQQYWYLFTQRRDGARSATGLWDPVPKRYLFPSPKYEFCSINSINAMW